MGAILSFLVTAFTGLFTSRLLYFTVFKLFIFTLFTVVLPTVILKIIEYLAKGYSSYVHSKLSTAGIQSLSLELIDLGGWLAAQVGLASCFSMIFSALALRFTLSLVQTRV